MHYLFCWNSSGALFGNVSHYLNPFQVLEISVIDNNIHAFAGDYQFSTKYLSVKMFCFGNWFSAFSYFFESCSSKVE